MTHRAIRKKIYFQLRWILLKRFLNTHT